MKLFGSRTHEVAERIVGAFQDPEQLPRALAPLFIHRHDDIPCRKWSWHNQLLVAMAGTSDARGMKQWNTVGRKVKKGSQALWILGPCMKSVLSENPDEDEAITRQVLIGFRSIAVFAVEDTEGDALPVEKDGHMDWMGQLPLVDVAESWGIRVDTFGHGNRSPLGVFRVRGDEEQSILLSDRRTGTWLHELVHASEYRLGALKSGETWHREVVAELGSAILMECLGITHDQDLGGAYDYIAHHAGKEKMPVVRACIFVLDRTCTAVQHLLHEAQRLHSVTA